MKYFKNLELARVYHISEKSVRNWISAAEQGKSKLELYHKENRAYIANTAKNQLIIEELVVRGSKYKNSRSTKIATPKPEFFELYSNKQILDMIANIGTHYELPFQYTYTRSGAAYWDRYAHKLFTEKAPNTLNAGVKLLELNAAYLEHLTSAYQHVNIVDLGPGNCLPIKGLLSQFKDNGKLGRYIAIDASHEMLKIAEHNITTWFRGEVHFEGYIRNINYDRFEDLLAQDAFTDSNGTTANLVLLFGGTLLNFRSPDHALQVIHSSMGKHDFFLQEMKLDSATSRRFFDLSLETSSTHLLAPQEKYVLDLLGIDESFYEVVQYFDERESIRRTEVKFKVDVTLVFKKMNKRLQLRKGETLLLWRVWHLDTHQTVARLEQNDFNVVQSSTCNNQEYILTIAKLKTELPK